MPNENLRKYLEKRINQPTVILCFKILLDNVTTNGAQSGMTKSEIAKIFNKENKSFGIQNFKTDYILRQTGIEGNAIYEQNDKFYIRQDFLQDVSDIEMLKVIEVINEHYSGVGEKRKQLYKEIEDAKALTFEEKRDFIGHLFRFTGISNLTYSISK